MRSMSNERLEQPLAFAAPATGPQLRLERQAKWVTILALAAATGWTRQGIAAIERHPHPRPRTVLRYRVGLAVAPSKGGVVK